MSRATRLVAAVGLGILFGVVPARAANDPGAKQQWNMGIVGAETAWATGRGAGITVAVVDTGVDFGHEDLAGRVLPGRNFVTPGKTPQDDHGHGTHVAGIAAAAANNGKGVIGVAPEARVLPVKVFLEDGSTVGSAIYDGIRWAADNGAQVINISLGVSLQAGPVATPIPSNELSAAVRYAWNKGVICVLSSGNDSSLASAFAREPGIVVTATGPNDRLAWYANDVGLAMWGMAAPGGAGNDPPDEDDILSTFWSSSTPNAYARAAGTSMSAPHVSGAAAVLRGLGLSAQQTVDRLRTTAKDLGTPGHDTTYGDGRLDVGKAVAGLKPGGGTTTIATGGGATTATTADRRTTTTTRSGSGSIKVVTPTTERLRAGSEESTSMSATSPTVPGDEVVAEDDVAAAAQPASDEDERDSDTIWPAALVALAALGSAGAALRRVRRVRGS